MKRSERSEDVPDDKEVEFEPTGIAGGQTA